MRSRVAKVVILISAVVSVAIFASTLLGQQPRSNKVARAGNSSKSTVSEPLPEGGLSAIQPGEGKVEVASSFTVMAHQLKTNAGSVDVHTAIRFVDSDDTFFYLWMVNVYNEDMTVNFVRRVYENQLFRRVDVDGEIVTFDEHLPLQSGRYQVRVTLLKVPENFDVGLLDDPKIEKQYCLVGGLGKVSVP